MLFWMAAWYSDTFWLCLLIRAAIMLALFLFYGIEWGWELWQRCLSSFVKVKYLLQRNLKIVCNFSWTQNEWTFFILPSKPGVQKSAWTGSSVHSVVDPRPSVPHAPLHGRKESKVLTLFSFCWPFSPWRREIPIEERISVEELGTKII